MAAAAPDPAASRAGAGAPPLLTPRLELRPWRDDAADLDAYAALCADPEVMRFIGDGLTRTREESAQQLARFAEHWERHGYGLRAAVERASGEVVGFAGIVRADEPGVRPGDVEIGWRLARRHWGLGFATEAACAVRDHAFADLRLARLVSFVRPGNRASLRVAEKLGMEPLKDGLCRRGLPVRILALEHPDAGLPR